ncbi:MAG: ABC transporter substrate-binding protein [Bacteroidales bacterium]|nr:ABC transporter substrate-binding protein [Bacteroidales bacterium]
MTRLSRYLFLAIVALPFDGAAQDQQRVPGEHLTPSGKIGIGLLLPDPSYWKVAEAAELAILEANDAGGYKQHDFELIIRTAEGFWGAGSKESVSLVYEDRVRAIIGSLDGRNGHLAEQVATKSHLTYMETFATEPTLSQAFVPWFMRVVPNDDQQAAVILDQIQKEGGGKTGILSVESYDTRYAIKSLTKAVTQKTGMAPVLIPLDTSHTRQQRVFGQIISNELDHLIIPYYAANMSDLIQSLGTQKPGLKIYGTLHFKMGMESRESGSEAFEGIYLIGLHAARESKFPDCRSAYLYDAVNLVINAIQHVGTDRTSITNYLSESTFYKGLSGTISFDELGNRKSVPSLLRIENGSLHVLNHP